MHLRSMKSLELGYSQAVVTQRSHLIGSSTDKWTLDDWCSLFCFRSYHWSAEMIWTKALVILLWSGFTLVTSATIPFNGKLLMTDSCLHCPDQIIGCNSPVVRITTSCSWIQNSIIIEFCAAGVSDLILGRSNGLTRWSDSQDEVQIWWATRHMSESRSK